MEYVHTRRATRAALALGLSVILWAVLGYLIFITDVGSMPGPSLGRIAAYTLLIAAPAATFIPLARWMHAPLYDVEGVVGWATFGFTLTFLRPSNPPSLAQFMLIVISVTIALATVASLVAYLLGLHFYRNDVRRHDVVRARRQGYLGAFCLVAMLLLYAVGTLTPVTAMLLVMIVVLAEVLILTSSQTRPEARRIRG